MQKTKVNARVYAALYLGSKDASQLVALANKIVFSMQGNLSVPDPVPALDDVTAATVVVSDAISADTGGALEIENLALAVNALQFLLVRLQQYAQNVANASPETAAQILISCGFEISKTAEKSPVPIAVTVLTASYTGQPGTILVEWDKANFAKAYQVLMSTTPLVPTSWTTVTTTTRKKLLVENLAASTRYYFCVISVGIAGNSLPSAPVSNITTMVG